METLNLAKIFQCWACQFKQNMFRLTGTLNHKFNIGNVLVKYVKRNSTIWYFLILFFKIKISNAMRLLRVTDENKMFS